MIGYINYDTIGKRAEDFRGHGHFTVYSNEKAAKRRANEQNNACYPKLTRWIVRQVKVTAVAQ